MSPVYKNILLSSSIKMNIKGEAAKTSLTPPFPWSQGQQETPHELCRWYLYSTQLSQFIFQIGHKDWSLAGDETLSYPTSPDHETLIKLFLLEVQLVPCFPDAAWPDNIILGVQTSMFLVIALKSILTNSHHIVLPFTLSPYCSSAQVSNKTHLVLCSATMTWTFLLW